MKIHTTRLQHFTRRLHHPPPHLKPLILLLLTLTTLLIHHHKPHNPHTFHITTSRLSITPQEPVFLSGYSWRKQPPSSNKTLDDIPLYARGISITGKKKGDAFVIITLDVVGIDSKFSDVLFGEVERKYGIGRERFKVVCSHTHSGPIVGGNLRVLGPENLGELEKVRRYEVWLMGRVLEVVGRVVGDGRGDGVVRKVCEGFYEVGRNGMAVNRREVLERMFFERGTHGLVDESVPVLWFRDSGDGRVVAVLYGYAAHATILSKSNVYSGDYPGVVSKIVEEQFLGAVAMFLPGAGGDQNVYPRGTVEGLRKHASSLGETVLQTVSKGLERKSALTGNSISGDHSFVGLPFRITRTKSELEQDLTSTDPNRAKLSRFILRDWKHDSDDSMNVTEKSYRYPLTLWRISGLRILFMGGEPTIGYSFGMKKRGIDWVIGYSDDVMGYVGTRAVLKEGKREGSDRAAIYYGLVSAWREEAEDILYNATTQLVSAT